MYLRGYIERAERDTSAWKERHSAGVLLAHWDDGIFLIWPCFGGGGMRRCPGGLLEMGREPLEGFHVGLRVLVHYLLRLSQYDSKLSCNLQHMMAAEQSTSSHKHWHDSSEARR